jgi:hypothetical protein
MPAAAAELEEDSADRGRGRRGADEDGDWFHDDWRAGHDDGGWSDDGGRTSLDGLLHGDDDALGNAVGLEGDQCFCSEIKASAARLNRRDHDVVADSALGHADEVEVREGVSRLLLIGGLHEGGFVGLAVILGVADGSACKSADGGADEGSAGSVPGLASDDGAGEGSESAADHTG